MTTQDLKDAMASKERANIAYDALRPLCSQMTKEQTVQNVRKLQSKICATDASDLQEILDYVLYPLRRGISGGMKKPGVVLASLECITYIFSITSLNNCMYLKEMFREFCCCFPADHHQLGPEDLKMSVILALQSLLRASTPDMLHTLFVPSMLPEMGFIITVLLMIAQADKSRELRLEALNCLDNLLFPEIDVDMGDLFATFFPGSCTKLVKIIIGDPKQGYKVTCGAMRLWCKSVATVMADESLAQVPKNKPIYFGLSETVENLMLHRDETWVKDCSNKITQQLEVIINHCTSNQHWKVRMTLVDIAQLLVTRCWNSLQQAVGSIMQILASHLNDEKPEVKDRVLEVIQEFLNERSVYIKLSEVLAEGLHSLAVTLPRLLSTQDDQGKLRTLALLLGYVQLLGPRLKFTLQSFAHLQRLSSALLQTLELDFSSVKVVEERLHSPVKTLKQEDLAHTAVRQKTFRFFRDPNILSHILSVCRLMGYYGDFYQLADHFLGLYRAQRLPAVIVLNQLVLGAAKIDIESFDHSNQAMEASDLLGAIRPLLEEYTDTVNWNLVTCEESNVQQVMEFKHLGKVPSVSQMAANAWKLCLQLEGISCFARALGHNFRPLLISSLYPLLEKAANQSLMVSGTAMMTLKNVSQACGYKNVNHLIELNSDYLVSEVSVGLRRFSKSHAGPACVMHVILENCGPSLLPLLKELVQDLLPALDHTQNDGTKILFPVLKCLLLNLAKWYPSLPDRTAPAASTASIKKAQSSLAQDVIQFFHDYKKQCRIASGDIKEEEFADVLPPSEDRSDDQKPPLPTHVQITKEVAEKCTHFLSHSDTKIRLQALETLKHSLVIIKPHEDVLLPLAHKIWPCLVKRLIQDEPKVLMQAFQLLMSLADSCKDFIRKRVCKDALPAFLVYLRSQANVSCHGGTVYCHNSSFKLQYALLTDIGKLCADLSLGDGDLLEVVDSCALYLGSKQPDLLQEAAFSALLSVAELDPDNVWLHLCTWQKPPAVPHSSLAPVTWTTKSQDEYSQNICKLLKKLQKL